MKKRLLSMLLIFLMMIAVLPPSALADDYDRAGQTDWAQRRYDNTDYFDHIDVRVNGSLTLNDGTSRSVRLKNVVVSVSDPGDRCFNGTVDHSGDTDEDYEWRKTKIRVSKSAVVTVACDIYLDGVKNNTETRYFTFSGETAFVNAIRACDMGQGLDFIISAQQILEHIEYYKVNYQWYVSTDGTMATKGEIFTLASPPSDNGDYEEGDPHTIHTGWQVGDYVIDEANGKIYVFKGWKVYTTDADDHATETTVENLTSLTINANTTIHGVWQAYDLDTAPGHLVITKSFSFIDENGNAVQAQPPEGFGFYITTPGGQRTHVPLTSFTENNGVYTYSMMIYGDGTYTVTEHGTSLNGFTHSGLSTTVTKGAGSTSFAKKSDLSDGVEIAVDLPYVNPYDTGTAAIDENDSGIAGEVAFVNSYTKARGENVHNYPGFYVLKENESGGALSGAQFTLHHTTDDAVADVVLTTDSTGYAHFTGLKPGVYTLTETVAPDNHIKTDKVYTVTVSQNGDPVETLINGEYVMVYNYTVYVADDKWYPDSGRLHVANEEFKGSLTISKEFAGDISADEFTGQIELTITGPDNYSNTVSLDAAGQWKVTLNDLASGTYTVTENTDKAQMTGYTLSTQPVQVTLSVDDADKAESATVTNTYAKIIGDPVDIYPDVVIEKRDSDTDYLVGGAEFTLTPAQGDAIVLKDDDNDGVVTFAKLVPGTYTLTESKAPEGYYKDDQVYTVTVAQSGQSTALTNGEWVTTTTYAAAISPDSNVSNNALVVYNTPITASLTVIKEFGEGSAITKDTFPSTGSITVRITGPNSYSKDVTLSSSNNWRATVSGLKIGTYTVAELTDLAQIKGYTLAAAYSAESVSFSYTSIDKHVTVTNTYTENVGEDVHYPAGFEVHKVDENGEPLAGATFTLYDSNNTVVTSLTTGEDGVAKFGGLQTAGTYTLKETAAPAGYKPTDTVWTITIGLVDENPELKLNNDKNVFQKAYEWAMGTSDSAFVNGVLTVENVPYEKITVTAKKVWVVPTDVTEPNSVKVALYKDGVVYDTRTLSADNNWTTSWGDLSTEFEWTVDEVSVPSGYTRKVTHRGNTFTITNYHRDVPVTGDKANIWLWTVLAIAAVGAVGYVLWDSKKRKTDRGA